ncbi:MAG: PTS sugar transporter subunit IIA [Solobacterium sp.]|nr:PTS sugar transporter subunit IIA [Solobacterium sp.]
MDSLSLQIIELLRKNAYLTSDETGKNLGVSERTVRSRIKEINSELIRNGAVINSERGRGNHLEVIDPDSFSRFVEEMYEENTGMPDTAEQRVSFLIGHLLDQKEYIYIDDLCELLYVARNTMSSDLKKAEQVLGKYDLIIQRRPNYGIRVHGKETDKRFCIIDHITHHDRFFLSQLKNDPSLKEIGDAMSQAFYQYGYKTSVENYQILRYLVCVSKERTAAGFTVSFDQKERDALKKLIPEGIHTVTENIVSTLGEEFTVLNTEEEKLYVSSQIAGRGSVKEMTEQMPHSDMDNIINNMLAEIRDGLRLDFTEDEEVMEALRNHMSAFDIRMRLHIPIENPALALIKKKYSLAYAAAYYVSGSLAERYHAAVSEDEIGYFAIIFAMALEKKKRPVQKKNVLIICPAGSTLTRFFLRNYRETFREYVENIYHCSVKELAQFDFAGHNIDCCFTTVDMKLDLPVPYYQISLFPSESEIRRYSEMFRETDRLELMDFYDPDLFIPHMHAESREDAIHQMVERIRTKYRLPDNFEELILQREKFGLTSFGNLTAMPHPGQACTEESLISLAILDQPVSWGQQEVQLILLVSMAADEERDVRTLIELTTDLISDENAVRTLIENRTYDQLIRLLIHNSEH